MIILNFQKFREKSRFRRCFYLGLLHIFLYFICRLLFEICRLALRIFLIFACGAAGAIRAHSASAVAVHPFSDDAYQGEYEHCKKQNCDNDCCCHFCLLHSDCLADEIYGKRAQPCDHALPDHDSCCPFCAEFAFY